MEGTSVKGLSYQRNLGRNYVPVALRSRKKRRRGAFFHVGKLSVTILVFVEPDRMTPVSHKPGAAIVLYGARESAREHIRYGDNQTLDCD
jgi:hypothetical protein